MKKLVYLFATFSFAFNTQAFSQTMPEHISSIKLNSLELVEAIPANQIEIITGKLNSKIRKEYSECSANYEYSATLTNGNYLKFEIYSEDNPQIKSASYYKTKNNFQQLGTTKGMVWLNWKILPNSSDKFIVNNKIINSQYTLNQFKKDFPYSAKQGATTVVMINPTMLKQYLKKPTDYDLEGFAHLSFKFKNGTLNQLEIDQAMAC